ncbi:MAG: sugar phosphate isomerase/epimerase [Treponema sp.]|jgi:sugar phosphate isomerase/epimerase|nr:sugar phosphate isomerase/epimerase [Treponema sp.]
MVITARTQMVLHKYSVDEAMQFFKDAGYDGIEFCIEDHFFNARPDYIEDFFIEHTVEKAQEIGIRIMSVGNHLGFVFDDLMFSHIKRTISKVRKFGTDIMIIATPDKALHKVSDPDCYKKLKSRLNELLIIADSNGVKLAMEPEPPHMIIGTADFLELCGELKYDLKINFDIGHAFLTDLDIYESIKLLKDKIVHTHVEDMRRGEHLHRLPGDGDMDLEKIFAALKNIGFTGALALDLYAHEYDKEAPGCARQMRDILTKI